MFRCEFQEILKSYESTFQNAAASLLTFIQANFTGPDLTDIPESPCSLTVDGEEANVNVKFPHLLATAEQTFRELSEEGNLVRNVCFFRGLSSNLLFQVFLVWYLRSIIIHQKVMDEPCITLYENFKATTEKISSQLSKISDSDTQTLIQLEIVQGYLLYKRVFQAEELLKSLKASLDLEIDISAALGVRTKFQTKALPQMTLNIQCPTQQTPASETHGSSVLPKLLALDDDLRLEKVKFTDESVAFADLGAVMQSVVLTQLKLVQLSQPKDNLSDEEVAPFILSLLHQDFGPWAIRLQALLTNIKQESNHKRTVERSLKQCEELVSMLKKPDPGAKVRLSQVFSSFIQPRWHIEALLGDLMISLGMIKTALDLFLKIQQWEDVIGCYTVLQLRHKAADVIRQELDKKPTVKLFCLLGDATDDVTWYQKAWEFSGEKSGQPMRHWGNFYFAKKDYESAIPYLEKTLQINSLQEVQWLRLGYAALSLENWELAAKAYRRYTHLEPNGFESWNNLAKAYIKLGDKRRAHTVLQESLKCNFNNWKVWENFLLVSIDVGSFEDAINAYTRLVEFKEDKYHDSEILRIITGAVATNAIDCYGHGAGRLKKKCLQLLAQQSAQNPTNGLVWQLSAKLTDDPLLRAQKLQKAHRGFTQTADWTKVEKSCEETLDRCAELLEVSLEAAHDFKDGDKMSVISQLSSANLAVNGCIKLAKQQDFESLKEKIEKLEGSLNAAREVMKSFK